MKTIVLTLLYLLSLPVLANRESPIGLFQVDSSHSKVTLADGNQNVSGFIDIHKNFSGSKLRLESGKTSFESTSVHGDLNKFTIRGLLTTLGQSREIELIGQYFGVIDKEAGVRIVALKISNPDCDMRILAFKPTESATALHREVQDIIYEN